MLEEQTVTITFGKGLDLKTDPNLVSFGNFLSLQNTIFDTLGQLRKRNGFGFLTSIPTIGSISYLTTFQNNLIGLGNNIQSYSQSLGQMINKGVIPQVSLSVIPVSNSLYGNTNCDAAFNNGLICVTSAQIGPAPQAAAGIPIVWQYSIIEQSSGQLVSGPTSLVNGSGGYQLYSPRVFSVGSSFMILYDCHNATTAGSISSLLYISVPVTYPFTPSAITTISSQCSLFGNLSFDGVVSSQSTLFVAWNTVPLTHLGLQGRTIGPPNFTQSPIFQLSASTSGTVGLGFDSSTQNTWFCISSSFYNSWITYYGCVNQQGVPQIPTMSVIGTGSAHVFNTGVPNVINNTISASGGNANLYIEYLNSYSYDANIPTSLLQYVPIQASGSQGASLFSRGLGIASKAYIYNSSSFILAAYKSPYQSTYFLLNTSGLVQTKFAYGNGYGYQYTGLPQVSVVGSSAFVPYLIQNTIQPVGKLTNVGSQNGIYGAFGINIAQFNYGPRNFVTKEIGNNLQINGGFLGNYDGNQFTENNVFLYPDSIELQAIGGGGQTPQTYFYSCTYEWPDNKGNIYRSAPSIPVGFTVAGVSSTIEIYFPTLRLSYKNWPYGGQNTPVKCCVYRWSQAQPEYHFIGQFVQDTTVTNLDSTLIVDGLSDNQIVANEILYTNGGVVEDISGPACTAITTFDSRLWLINAEDQNQLGYSKQVIEDTPVEMSDLSTLYVAPNIGAEGPTGNMKCLAPMDDKLIIFKQSAIYYINGIGPDNTDANSQYSEPIFVTSAVGCVNQNSIVLIPNGLMFQSNKGIWLLGRDLSTAYIGKDVEAYNSATVLSALTVPQTNQVRFTLNNGITLLYDYFVNQWGTFNGIPGVSSCLYQNLHTYVNSSSSLFQETPGLYVDGTSPTLMSFQTGWIGLAGLEGYQRAYRSYLLGNYYSPHNFTMGIGYDYNPFILQTITVNPTNTVGSGSQVEQWQLNFQKQQCQSLQLTFNEVSSQSAGQGLTISGLKLEYGVKKGFPRNLGAGNKTS